MLNELAQWAVLIFLAIFVFGLTRQLGLYVVPRQQQLEDLGPPLKRPLPSKLVGGSDRSRLVEMVRESPGRWGGVLVVDEACSTCTDMIEDMVRAGKPEGAPLAAITNSTGMEFQQELGEVVDLVVLDRKSERCHEEGIYVTPFVMIVDDKLKVVHKQVGNLQMALDHWRSHNQDVTPESNGSEASDDSAKKASVVS